MSKHEGDFAATVRRLAADHSKRSDANGEAQEASAARRRDFLLGFEDKARNEIEPVLDQAAALLREAGRVKAGIELADDNERVELSVTVRDREANHERIHKLLFLADAAKCRITVHEGTVLLKELSALSELRQLSQGRTPAIATLTLDQLDRAEVESQVQRFLREALR